MPILNTISTPYPKSDPNGGPPGLTIGEKISATGANEELCAIIHRALCRKSPIGDLSTWNIMLSILSPDEVVAAATAITHPAVQSDDILGIMTMTSPPQAPQAPIPEVSASPVGLGCIQGFDHRLGAWK